MKKLVNSLKKTIFYKKLFPSDEDTNKKVEKKQNNLTLIVSVVGLILVFGGIYLFKAPKKVKKEIKSNVKEIATSTEVLSQDKIWNKYFEDKLIEERKQRDKLVSELKEEINNTQQTLQSSLAAYMSELKEELNNIKLDKEHPIEQNITQSNNFAEDNQNQIIDLSWENQNLPKNIKYYVPSGTYAKGYLLGGISVPTGVNIQSDPMPILIRMTDIGITPGQQKVSLKNCRVIGSCYGDLSSERAIIRLETISCANEGGDVYESKISGTIFGPDGLANIKGEVVSMDSKNIKNAMLASFMMGVSKISQNPIANLSIIPPVAADKSKSKFKTRVIDGGLEGASAVSEKLADYFIKRAESISPVVQVPGGVRVDVFFAKGVYIGREKDLEKDLKKQNNSKNNN